MIDVHAHTLQCSAHAVQDAHDAGVQHVVSVSETLAEARELLTVANVCPCIGVHPVQPVMVQGQRTGVRSVTLEDLEGWGRVWEQGKMRFVGIGEGRISRSEMDDVKVTTVGLDFSPHVLGSSHNTLGRDKCKEIQKEVFRRQIKEALAKDLPLNVHSRYIQL
jgi:Tat protein secretion system quality control protein TatD with DNase activity